MPTRNSRKQYAPQSYYHTYSRGVNKQAIFLDEQDYSVFLDYLKRYLSPGGKKSNGQYVRDFAGELSLISYCLMPNHIHLLWYQHDNDHAYAELMQRLLTCYSMYFNKKYHRVGPLFQGRYLASQIDSDSYLMHVSRYIHLNPRRWREYPYSSLAYFTGEKTSKWVLPQRLLEIFDEQHIDYLSFVEDYESRRDELDVLKLELTNEQ